MKVAIGIPANGFWCSKTGYDLWRMSGYTQKHRPDIDQHMFKAEGSILPNLREQILDGAAEGGCSHILWVDSDMGFPADALIRLLDHKKDIVGANCVMRQWPHYSTAVGFDGKNIPTRESSTGLEKVLQVGTGFTLMRINALLEMEKPRFSFAWSKAKQVLFGEDVRLCHEMNKRGYEIWIDHDLSKQIQHIGLHPYRHQETGSWNEATAERAVQFSDAAQ